MDSSCSGLAWELPLALSELIGDPGVGPRQISRFAVFAGLECLGVMLGYASWQGLWGFSDTILMTKEEKNTPFRRDE